MMTENEEKKLDELIEKLDVFFSNKENFDEEGYASDTDCPYGVDPYDALVCDNIGVPYEKTLYMGERGYEVVCLDRDSFGWLMGGISKVVDGQRRLLTFG
jgi:hypothetical protein